MKTFFICSPMLLAVSCAFFSCDSNEVIQVESLPSTDKEAARVSTFCTSIESKGKYCVELEDAKQFAMVLRPGKEFSIEPYVVEEDTLLYLINYEEGWIIIAGDKRINPTVAESDTGNISLKSNNVNLRTWIDSYADEIRVLMYCCENGDNEFTKLWSNIIRNKSKTDPQTRGSVEYKWAVVSYTYLESESNNPLISHLVSTKWGQGLFWNVKLPIDTNNNEKCPIGCVAVALSQIVYYMHYYLGKPSGLYHNISIDSTSISGPTTNIGFSRSNYVSNSTHWDDMSLERFGVGNEAYVGDLMLDMGNRLGMSYSGSGSSSHISATALSYFNLAYSQSTYNYQTVRNDLFNSKPVNITASYRENGSNERIGHSWIIDGIGEKVRHYVVEKHFEYTENWMHESEYYNTFDELRWHYHINSEYDIVEEDGGTYTTEYLLMNWGYDGAYNEGYYTSYPSSVWTVDGKNYSYDKTINYNFR